MPPPAGKSKCKHKTNLKETFIFQWKKHEGTQQVLRASVCSGVLLFIFYIVGKRNIEWDILLHYSGASHTIGVTLPGMLDYGQRSA